MVVCTDGSTMTLLEIESLQITGAVDGTGGTDSMSSGFVQQSLSTAFRRTRAEGIIQCIYFKIRIYITGCNCLNSSWYIFSRI